MIVLWVKTMLYANTEPRHWSDHLLEECSYYWPESVPFVCSWVFEFQVRQLFMLGGADFTCTLIAPLFFARYFKMEKASCTTFTNSFTG